jgi:hypothetical protein
MNDMYDDDMNDFASMANTGNGLNGNGTNGLNEAGSSGKDSNDPVADFEVEEPSYQDMLHGNVRRMSSTVRIDWAFLEDSFDSIMFWLLFNA